MAVSAFFYGNAFVSAFNGLIDFDTDTIKVALLDSGHAPSQDVHNFFDDVVADEVAGTGYTAGGATLAGASITYTGGTNTLKLDGADVSWAGASIAARYAVVYKATGTNSTSPLIVLVDFGEDKVAAAGDFDIVWDAAGIATVVVS